MRPAIFTELRKAVRKKQGIIMLESALFAEENLAHPVNNHLIVISVDEKTQLARLQQREGNTAKQISKLLSSQLTTDEKYEKLLQKRTADNYGDIMLIDNSAHDDADPEKERLLRETFRKLVTASGIDS